MGSVRTLFVPVWWGDNLAGAAKAGREMLRYLDVDLLAMEGGHVNGSAGAYQAKWLATMWPKVAMVARKYDVIHLWGAFPGAYLPKMGRPYILSCHGTDVPGRSNSSDRVLNKAVGYKRIFRGAAAVTAINAKLTHLIKKFSGVDAIVVPNGVRRNEAIANPGNRMVTAARLIPSRKIDRLVLSMTHLPDHSLDIYGDGPLRGELLRLIYDKKLQRRVRLMGWVLDAEAFIQRYNIYIQACEASGPTLGFLEARSSGLACVTTRFYGWNAFNSVAAKDDSPLGIASAVLSIDKRHYKLDKLIKWEEVARRYNAIYKVAARI